MTDPASGLVNDSVAHPLIGSGLADVIEGHALRTPLETALHFASGDISYAQLWQRIESATVVLAGHGVRAGDRIAWLGLNDPAQLVLLCALARLGAVLLPLNYRLAQAEMAAILAHAEVSLIVADALHRPVTRALAREAVEGTEASGELFEE